MIDSEMVRFLLKQLDSFPQEQLRNHLLKEGCSSDTINDSLREALRLRSLPPSGFFSGNIFPSIFIIIFALVIFIPPMIGLPDVFTVIINGLTAFGTHFHLERTPPEYCELFLFILVVAGILQHLIIGRTTTYLHPSPSRPTFYRNADPTGYWTCIALEIIFAIAILVIMSRDWNHVAN